MRKILPFVIFVFAGTSPDVVATFPVRAEHYVSDLTPLAMVQACRRRVSRDLALVRVFFEIDRDEFLLKSRQFSYK